MAIERSLHDEITRLQNEAKKFQILTDITRIARDDDFKDLTVLTRGEKFRVHRFMMAARSPMIERLLKSRPETESVTFTDIPMAAFRELLRFVYDNELPSSDANFRDILAAASKLEVEPVKSHAVGKLIESLNVENAVDVLALANKLDIELLRTKAFAEVQKIFPDRELKGDMATDVGKVKKLIEAKKKFDEEFQNL
jgi:hypothetical protein